MSERVLLVDDEEDFINLLSERLSVRDVDVTKSTSPVEALEKVKSENYDMVVLDLQMPEMDGIKAMEEILKVNPDMQILILTGHATVDKGIKAMKLGAMDFVEKPVKIEELVEKIKTAQANKMMLVESKMKDKINELISNKGW